LLLLSASFLQQYGLGNKQRCRVSPSLKPRSFFQSAHLLCWFFTAIWTWKQTTVPGKPVAKTQIILSIGAFIVLVFALGEPFAGLSWYDPGYGSLSLIFYALLVGMITPRE
jgi:hypothetical protein